MTNPDERRATPNDLAGSWTPRLQGPAMAAADAAGRIWGLVLLVAGLWLFARITLKLDVPMIPWGDLWPILLIVLGGLVILGATRRR
jgi:hypothetical protein